MYHIPCSFCKIILMFFAIKRQTSTGVLIDWRLFPIRKKGNNNFNPQTDVTVWSDKTPGDFFIRHKYTNNTGRRQADGDWTDSLAGFLHFGKSGNHKIFYPSGTSSPFNQVGTEQSRKNIIGAWIQIWKVLGKGNIVKRNLNRRFSFSRRKEETTGCFNELRLYIRTKLATKFLPRETPAGYSKHSCHIKQIIVL